MRGFVEFMSATRVKGWAHDPGRETPATVRVVLNQNVVAECLAGLPRADVAKALNSSGLHGFDIALDGKITAADLPDLQVVASSGAEWEPLKIFKGKKKQRLRTSYQDFDGTGSSKSHEKLEALRLYDLPRSDRDAPPLRGKSVLDLGCNEGFFCAEAVCQGAARVIGIDFKQSFIESARRRCPEATFIHGSWWDVPDEKFDCILLLSAIHYEPEQKKLLRKLRDHLAPGGVLVLECGVFVESGVRAWRSVKRWDGVRRYPTVELLKRDLLEGYAVRPAGRSVDQKGDPVERYVFHCTRRESIALIIAAPSLSGKTVFSFELEGHGIPVHSTDGIIARLVLHADQEWSPLAQKLSERFKADRLPNIARVAIYIVENRLEDELCEIIVNEVPAEADLFCIQGDVLRHPSIQDALKQKLIARNIRPWLVTPL
jgi:SAM-dependent methyltransferase